MDRKGRRNNSNRLLYDPNQREQRRLGAFSMQENNEEETDVTSEEEVAKDVPDTEEVEPKESVTKQAAKEGVKKATNAAGKAIASGVKKLGAKLIAFIAANPWVLGVALLVILIIIILFGAAADDEEKNGYYDKQCNYNDTIVNFSSCNEEFSVTMSLKDYVLRSTYSITKNNDLNSEAIKALMIIMKTNALSVGGYNSSSKRINVNDCTMPFGDYANVKESDYKNLENSYNFIEDYIYVSSSYKEAINYLSYQNYLEYNNEVLDEIKNISAQGNSYSSILNAIYNTADSELDTTDEYRSNLFIGDSRMQGMQIAGVVNSSNSVYGVGYGYNWFIGDGNFGSDKTNATSGGINGINAKMTEGKKYNIFIWLGVNDYAGNNAQKYFNKYLELANNEWKNHNIYIISLGPVDDDKAQYVDNAGIDKFNNEMSKLISDADIENLRFLSLNYSIENYDDMGVHYGSSDYKRIFNMIQDNAEVSLNKQYSLYNLADYCTFYQITENDAYWWPIGSAEATKGNIYGGNPTATIITSPFGMRSGVYDTARQHNGIDISGGTSCYENVIIAAKAGTVVEVYDGCPTKGYVGNTCGGSLGNHVIIEHEDGVRTIYGHMSLESVVVKEGDVVEQGQKLGIMGSSGSSNGCHLHFGMKINDGYVNPKDYVSVENARPVLAHNYVGAGNATENKEYVCKSLLLSGYSESAVAGMMVNIQHEGGFKTNNLENCYEEGACCNISGKKYGYCNYKQYLQGFATDDKYTAGIDDGSYPRDSFINDHAGYGLIQWTSGGRKANLYDFAKLKGKSIADIDVQLEYLLNEVRGYKITNKYITGNYGAYEIASAFCKDFERPSGSTTDLNTSDSCTSRASESAAMLKYVQNGCK